MIGALEGPGSRLFRSIYKTYRTAFPSVLVHPAILPRDEGDEQRMEPCLLSHGVSSLSLH